MWPAARPAARPPPQPPPPSRLDALCILGAARLPGLGARRGGAAAVRCRRRLGRHLAPLRAAVGRPGRVDAHECHTLRGIELGLGLELERLAPLRAAVGRPGCVDAHKRHALRGTELGLGLVLCPDLR